MRPRQLPAGPGVVLLLSVLVGGWFLQRGVAQDQTALSQARLFQEVMDHIADRYVEPVDRDALYESAIEGVLNRLGDQNTSLLNVEAYENFRIQTEGDYGGLGLEIVERDDYITVVAPIPGTPGAQAGIRAGDLIVEVSGESTRGWVVQQAVQVLRGQPGSPVDIRIRRAGLDEPIDFTIVRERIQLRSVPFSTLLEGGVGYVPLGLFSEVSTQEVRAAADSLRNVGATSLVLDLRGNPGGLLDQGVGITDLFLPRGAEIVETRGQGGSTESIIRASSGDRYEGMPVVVLVDRGSASASEIVAGALQDHDRALIIGSTTFGKGSVQSLFSLSGGNVLKLTTARWYTPQGRSIERVRDLSEEPEEEDPLESDGQDFTITVTGQIAVPPDTAGRPTVTSVGGRVLYAGGGIVPDLLPTADTLSTEEQVAVRALFQEGGRYSAGLFDYAVEFLRQHGTGGANFQVTDAHLDALYQALLAREVRTDRDSFRRAERFVRQQLEAEIAQQGWGQEAAFLRRLPADAPLQEAIRLLRDASSPQDLFSRADPARGAPATAAFGP